MLAELQSDFRAGLLDPDRAPPNSLRARRGAADRGFSVYRNNVVVSLVDALAARFPAAVAIVGEDFFRAMAREFVRSHPPRSPILLLYGGALPAWTENFPPAAGLPYLADVMRLEFAIGEAYHAADARPATLGDLGLPHRRKLADARVALHPAVRLVSSQYPVATIRAMSIGETEPAPVADWRGEDVLVTRPRHDVRLRRLRPGGFAFASALRLGRGLGDAVDAGLAASEDFDPGAMLAELVAAGALMRFTQED
jgi:hypothetical protein